MGGSEPAGQRRDAHVGGQRARGPAPQGPRRAGRTETGSSANLRSTGPPAACACVSAPTRGVRGGRRAPQETRACSGARGPGEALAGRAWGSAAGPAPQGARVLDGRTPEAGSAGQAGPGGRVGSGRRLCRPVPRAEAGVELRERARGRGRRRTARGQRPHPSHALLGGPSLGAAPSRAAHGRGVGLREPNTQARGRSGGRCLEVAFLLFL